MRFRLFVVVLLLFGSSLAHAQDITTGLVVHYSFNAGFTSTVPDDSGTGNVGAVFGTPTAVAGPTGFGQALQLDAANDYVQRTTGISLPTGATAPFTLAAWIKATSYIDLAHLFGFGTDPPSAVGDGSLRSFLSFQNHYYFWGGGADWDTGVAFDVDNTWHHIALTASATTLRFYRDGVPGPTSARPGALTTATVTITLGSRNASGADFVGYLDDVRIYARELTAGDITALVTGTAAVAARRRPLLY